MTQKKTMSDLETALREMRRAEQAASRLARQLNRRSIRNGGLDLDQLSARDREWVLDDLAWD